MAKVRIALTGGGSGGHFYPLVAVAEHIRETYSQDSVDLLYLGPESYNAPLLDKYDISFIQIPSGKRTKYFSVGNLFTPFKIIWGAAKAVIALYRWYPDVVFSKGSYTSVPVVLAAAFLRIPIVIHESDTKVGSANKLATKFARYIAIAYDDVAKAFPTHKTALVGIPLRQELLVEPENPLQQLGLPVDRPLLFVVGGSQGAKRINELVTESLDELLPHFTILHQVGTGNAESITRTASSLITDNDLLTHYYVRDTLSSTEMNLTLSGAHLIVSRAGSGSIFEIAHKGKPSIIIPIPEAISHDQRTNAFAYARSGAASVLEEGNLTDGLLSAEITRIMSDAQTYQNMSNAAKQFAKHDAAKQLTEIIIGIAQEHK